MARVTPSDRPVSTKDDLTVVQAIQAYKREAEEARRERLQKNRQNQLAYLGLQDWSHKIEGQSREFLPKVPMAVEQFAAFIKRALIAFGDWFQVEVAEGAELTAEEIRRILLCKLRQIGPEGRTFDVLMSDAVKTGALGSLIVLKVHGRHESVPRVHLERGVELLTVNGQEIPRVVPRLVNSPVRQWRLLIDLVKPDDYFPDPTGRGLYEIQEVERDLSDVLAAAEEGVYDRAVVRDIQDDFAQREDEWRRAQEAGQDVATPPSFRKRLLLQEFHGTILTSRGHLAHQNVICTLANDRWLIRKPTPNPEWHGGSPFVTAPLVRVPFSVWHKALMDHAVSLNLSMNELFSLMLDGGIASVWGIRQIRTDWLEDARQVSSGIPQGTTLAVRAEMPAGQKVLETVTEGKVPPDALAMLNLAERNFQEGALTSDLKVGQLPPRQVKATEILESSAGQAGIVDALARDVEQQLIEPVLRKSWMLLLQHADDLAAEDVVAMAGPRAALRLGRMTPEERFVRYGSLCKFRVFGLSAVVSRVRDFSRLMALMTSVAGNPLLLQAFVKRFSSDRLLTHILKTLNIDPMNLEKTPEEMQQAPQDLAQLPGFMDLIRGRPTNREAGGPPSLAARNVGESALPSEIGQMAEPTSGF